MARRKSHCGGLCFYLKWNFISQIVGRCRLCRCRSRRVEVIEVAASAAPRIGRVNFVKLIQTGRHSVYLDLFYPVFKMRTPGASDADFSLLIVQLMDHVKMMGLLHYDFGAGLYQSRLSSSLTGQTTTINKSYFGFFLGLSLDFPAASSVTLSPSIRVHAYQADSEWMEFVFGGLNVYFSLF